VNDFDELRASYYCAAELIRSRQRIGQPIPEWLRKHLNQLDEQIRSANLQDQVRKAKSRPGLQSASDAGQLEPQDLITAREVAMILGCSKRHAVRLACDLDGRIIGNRWLFNRNTVIDYAEEKQQDAV
jgi:hypothetical protein